MTGISVVIPSYNRANLLPLTVRSILAQTVPADEIIVVDDGSTDHTAEVCAAFPEPVRYIRQTNRGLPGARNTGIRASGGKWIAFCDSDDLWTPRKLEIQLAALAATGAGWSVTDFVLIDPDGDRLNDGARGFARSFPVFSELALTPDEHLSRWLNRDELTTAAGLLPIYQGDAFGLLFEGNVVLPSTAVVARELINRAGAFNEAFRFAEETEFFHRIAAYSHVAIVMNPLAEYRVGHASIISGDNGTALINNALRSIQMAALLRPSLSEAEITAFRVGRRRLRTRLAYQRLSRFDGTGARSAIADLWREDHLLSARSTAILIASLLPPVALKSLHRAKRALRGQALNRKTQ